MLKTVVVEIQVSTWLCELTVHGGTPTMTRIPIVGQRRLTTVSVKPVNVKTCVVGGLSMAGEIALIAAAVCIALGIIVLLLTLRDR
jgi:hypothetical protein